METPEARQTTLRLTHPGDGDGGGGGESTQMVAPQHSWENATAAAEETN